MPPFARFMALASTACAILFWTSHAEAEKLTLMTGGVSKIIYLPVTPAWRRAPTQWRRWVPAAAIFQGSTAHYLLENVAHLGAGSTCPYSAALMKFLQHCWTVR